MIAALIALSWLLAVTYDGWARRGLTRLVDRVSPGREPAQPRTPAPLG
jgi:hypothetical protein